MCKYALGATSITGTQSNELLRARNCSALDKSYMIGRSLRHALKIAVLCAGGFLAGTTRKFSMQSVIVHCFPSPASRFSVGHLIMFPGTKVTTIKGNEPTSWWQCFGGKARYVYEPP